MNLDTVFVMFIAIMAILFIIIFFMSINEKNDSELSIEDIKLYKRLKMVTYNKLEYK